MTIEGLLEYEATGTLADPRWWPTNFSLPAKIANRLRDEGEPANDNESEPEAAGADKEDEEGEEDGEERKTPGPIRAKKGPLKR